MTTAAATASRRTGSDRLWLWWLTGSAVLIAVVVAFLLLGWLALGTPLYMLAAFGGALGPVLGVVRYRPQARAAWLLLAAYQVAFVAGVPVTIGQGPAFPGPADVLFLVVYPLLIAAVVVLVRCRSQRRQPVALLDAGIITTSIALVASLHLIGPLARAHNIAIAGRLVGAAYPVLDLLLLAVALRLVLAPGRRPPAYYLLVGGLLAYLVTDLGYCAMRLTNTYTGPFSLIAMGYLIPAALFGAAGLHPSMTQLDQPPRANDTAATGRRITYLSLASLIIPGELVIQTLRDTLTRTDTLAIAVAYSLLLLLILIRMATLE